MQERKYETNAIAKLTQNLPNPILAGQFITYPHPPLVFRDCVKASFMSELTKFVTVPKLYHFS